MYTYPVRPTGTAEDLMSLVARASELWLEKERIVLPRKSAWSRLICEPPFNCCGLLLRFLMELLPAERALALHERMFSRAAGRTYAFDDDSAVLARAAAEVRALEAEAGRAPGLLAVLSHPPVLGETSHINPELVRHGCRALRAARGRPCRPRLVAAVDAFALDTVSLPVEGLYAGFMGCYHLGFDRLSFARGPASRVLLGRAAWPSLAGRLLRRLGRGQEAVMVLAGGVPGTARMLYAAREWIAQERRRSPLKGAPAEVLRRLRQDQDFRVFEACGLLAPRLRRNAWRMLEAWTMSAVAGHPWKGAGARPSCAEAGVLDQEARADLAQGLLALRLDAESSVQALARLEAEWPRETPFRRRIFRIWARRLLARGRPLVIMPVVHRAAEPLGITVRDAWSCRSAPDGGIRARVLGDPARDWQGSADAFAEFFGRENYS